MTTDEITSLFVLARSEYLWWGHGLSMTLCMGAIPTCLRNNVNGLMLAFINILGSIVFSAVVVCVAISRIYGAQFQADVCGFYVTGYYYYSTELALFVNRLLRFYSMDVEMQKKLHWSRNFVVCLLVGSSFYDGLTRRSEGVTLWNDEEVAWFCTLPATLYHYITYPMIGGGLCFNLYMGFRTVFTFFRSQEQKSKSKKESYRVLKLMLVSFTSTIFATSFTIINITIPWPPLNFVVDHILIVVIPIDTFLSLALSFVVFHKLLNDQVNANSLNHNKGKTPPSNAKHYKPSAVVPANSSLAGSKHHSTSAALVV